MPSQSFHDIFGRQAQNYARYRPGYPAQLFDFVVSLVPSRQTAWDCGTGNGQAAVALARYFDSVIATDKSALQIEKAEQKPNIIYRVLAAETTDLGEHSTDLVTCANAVHWFDIPAFFKEVRRVLKPRGVVAVWCYSSVRAQQPVQEALDSFTAGLKPYWPASIELVTKKYQTLEFPFEEIEAPPLQMEVDWTMEQIAGYISTWSAVQRFRDQVGVDPIIQLREQLKPLFKSAEEVCRITFPLPMRVGRV